MHMCFSGGRSGGLIIPSLSEFSPVCCDPHSQRLWHSQQSRVDIFLELSCFFYDPTDVDILIFDYSAFFKSSLNIWKFVVHILLQPCLENFEHYIASRWDECNSAVVWTFFAIAFLCNWNEYWPFSVFWLLLSFTNLLVYWMQHFHIIIFSDLK